MSDTDGSPNGPEVVVDSEPGLIFAGALSLSHYVHNGQNYLLTWSTAPVGENPTVFGRILDVSNVSSPFAGNKFTISPSSSSFLLRCCLRLPVRPLFRVAGKMM